jgi:hypothetical protein
VHYLSMGRPQSVIKLIRARRLEAELAALQVRQNVIDCGLPDGSGIKPENWGLRHQYSYFVCPQSRGRYTCTEPECGAGGSCIALRALGLRGDGQVLPKQMRPACGARTRQGASCKAKVVPGKRRCRLHGGLSSGPRTALGRERISNAQRQRWSRWQGHETRAEELGLVSPVKMSPDEVCSLVAAEADVRAAAARLDRATPSTCRDLVHARLAAQARLGIHETDRAPLYSGQVEDFLMPVVLRMSPGDERAILLALRTELARLCGEYSEAVLKFMLKSCRHSGTETLQRMAGETTP